MSELYFAAASSEHQKRERAKARDLRQSQWWKGQLGLGVCYHCKQHFHPGELTMDHLLPIARGGKSDRKNCVPCCKECNSKKGYKTTTELAFAALESSSKSSENPNEELEQESQQESEQTE